MLGLTLKLHLIKGCLNNALRLDSMIPTLGSAIEVTFPNGVCWIVHKMSAMSISS